MKVTGGRLEPAEGAEWRPGPREPGPWWKDAVFYEIYPRSFADSDGDGTGDLRGVLARLDYLVWLGVDAIWLCPFYPSPGADFGYDVSDYCDVDPSLGTLGDFDALLAACHVRGLRLIVDWVPNHTSSEHPWFRNARSDRAAAKRDWYIWRAGAPDRPPNNWRSAFGGPSWTWDATTGEWYLHLFLPEQPDLNWSNPAVERAMHEVLRFWLDRGVDGFRADVVHCIGKSRNLPDEPLDFAEVSQAAIHDYRGTHDLLRRIRRVIDSYPGERMIVGEVNLRETLRVATYYGTGDELNLAFNFLSLDAGWNCEHWRHLISSVGQDLGSRHAWPTWVLSNHDNSRQRSRLGSEGRARAAAMLLLTLRGTPFLYQGEELGLEDADVPHEQRVDPGGRDGARAPIPWNGTHDHGWPATTPRLPFPPAADDRNAADLAADATSILALYRRLLATRRGSAALRRGTLELLDTAPPLLAYLRRTETEAWLVAVNFGKKTLPLDCGPGWELDTASGKGTRIVDSIVEIPSETAALLKRDGSNAQTDRGAR